MQKKTALLFLLLTTLVFTGAYAQNKNVRKAENSLKSGDLKEAQGYINPATKDEKTSKDAKTWYLKGEIYTALAKKDSATALGDAYNDTAFTAYKKCLEIDPKYTSMLLTSYKPLSDLYVEYWKKGATAFNNKDYKAAFSAFKHVKTVNDFLFHVSDSMAGNKIDTMAILNIGNAAYNMGERDTATEYYQRLADLGYKDESFVYKVLLQQYRDSDEDKFFAILGKAKGLFPDDKDFTNSEISYYNEKGETDKLVEKLEEAAKKDPNDYSTILNLAIAYDNMANPKTDTGTSAELPANHDELFEKSVNDYKKAISLNSDGYAANFNLGLMYYNAAAQVGKSLGKLTDQSKQDTLLAKQNVYLEEALPYLQKAYDILDAKDKLDPNEMAAYKNAIIGLQGVYARKNDMDTYNKMKEKLDNADAKAQ